MARPTSARLRRAGLALALTAAAAPAPRAQEAGGAQGPGAPPHLVGVDLTLPAPEAFRAWPPDELTAWFFPLPWGAAAFQRAALFGQPVFFVLTVNWSRGSARLLDESLADPELLRLINANYITVVVNADLRPDLRERYQTGAWPVVAFLLPDGRPMLSQVNDLGVAQPITTSAVDSASLRFLVQEGIKYWAKWSRLLLQVGREWAAREGPDEPRSGVPDAAASEAFAAALLAGADRVAGGFTGQPRFVIPGLAEYAALREARGLPALAEHARRTLDALVGGPLYDRAHGGAHRLLAGPDAAGLEREKLLEANAALIRELSVAMRRGGSPAVRDALAGSAAFVTRRLARPGGGFYLAERAELEPGTTEPALDRLVLSGPNALAGAALLRAGLVLDDAALLAAGQGALELVAARALAVGRGVQHAIEPAPDGRLYLGCQADVAFAFADAYETTGQVRWLDAAQDIADAALRNLRDGDDARLVDHLADPVPIGLLANARRPLRPNARLARALLRLELHGRGAHYRDSALAILQGYAGDLGAYGALGVEGALAIEEALTAPLQVRIRGAADDPRARALRREAAVAAWPWIVIGVEADGTAGPAQASVSWSGGRIEVRDARRLARALARIAAGEIP